MASHYKKAVNQFHKLSHLEHASTFLSWDQQVMMPEGGSDARADALAELAALQHEFLTSPKLDEQLSLAEQESLSSDQKVSLLEMKMRFQQASSMPSTLVKAMSLATSRCQQEWSLQRRDNDWKSFSGNLKNVVKLAREEAEVRQSVAPEQYKTPYDAMLDLYSRGDTSQMIDQIFGQLKVNLPPLIQRITETQPPKNKLEGPFELEQQKQLSLRLMTALGFDFNKGRLDVSSHPFSTGVRGDHRITTRYRESEFKEALLATAHETGHASYEAGLPESWNGLPVGQARSMSVHESQSLLFEKQIFLSDGFMSHFYPIVQDSLKSLRSVSLSDYKTQLLYVEPSLIRVEADEVTYPLHIIIRHEIERDLINGSIEVADIPDLWNEGMKNYLGIDTRGNYRDGCMQDIHWPSGAFGYFPSYTLGALNSAQLFTAIRNDNPDWNEQLAQGDLQFIRSWLNEKVWQRASLVSTAQLMTDATGKSTEADSFLAMLVERYG